MLCDVVADWDSVFLHAIFPSIARIPDRMGSKSSLTTAQMICFLVYWYIHTILPSVIHTDHPGSSIARFSSSPSPR